ncbi:hypothetical protein SLITK23_01700 [Streptomyces lividans]|uniref:Uncharacterized protein n=1 Tax=Streptomyces lividans TK24 TaxID=457428 RepID=A0ABN4E3Y1_STRLI|nr:hypothetical protein SLIV_36770 [Streptomyces lividans TK24]KKD11695.1 oxidoreductase [Streptomyces sp. WM6391]QSJ13846.1 hypothetical protein SLIVDG2_36770 [Streptomyces lividans]EFD71730.1 predicted protein [Streptomyces lividans TK24]QTD74756.1 hypothetical protein SLIVYQS_36770 [Streptomyces lividans TK24] [Streptomyces lividans]
MRNPVVTSPIVGVTKPAQSADAIAAVDVELDEDEASYLEEPFCRRQPMASPRWPGAAAGPRRVLGPGLRLEDPVPGTPSESTQ